MTKLNKRIAESLGMEIPAADTTHLDEARAVAIVKPHEIATIDNPDLPDMADIDIKMAEGEKQLEEIIVAGLAQMTKMFENAADASPDKVARYLEVAQMMMSQTFSAIAHKTKLQLEKKKLRMTEKSFKPEGKESGGGGGPTTNNLFVGSREDMMDMLEKNGKQ